MTKCYDLSHIDRFIIQKKVATMAELKIPDSGYIGLQFIGRLRDEQYEALIAAVQSFEPVVYPATSLERIVRKVTGEGDGIAERIAESVAGVPLLYKRSELSQDDFLEALSEDLSERWDAESDESSLIPTILRRVAPLLEVEALSVSSEALKMAVDLPNSFSDASFSVDMRPVFYPDDDSIGGVMLVATMQLSYFDGSDPKDLNITFDEVDLDALSDAIDSAKQKIAASRKLIKEIGVPFVPVTQSRRME